MTKQKGFVSPIVILFVILPLIGFYIGTQYKQIVKIPNNSSSQVEDLQKQLSQKEQEIQLIIQDSASVGEPTGAPYSFSSFNIYSPLFENKEVQSLVYTYKRQIITKKDLILEQDDQQNSTSGVTVWEYTKWNLPTLDVSKPNLVIFGGYENYLNHPTIVDISPKDKESYITNNLKMYWDYAYCPKSICNVTLNFYSSNNPSGHGIYVQIWANNSSYPTETGINNAGITKAKEKLKSIADTISLQMQ